MARKVLQLQPDTYVLVVSLTLTHPAPPPPTPKHAASLVAIDLARKVLQLQPNTYVLVVSHENITNNWYPGQDRSMLVPNCIFRSNGAAMLLTNKASESWWVQGLGVKGSGIGG